MNSQISSTMKGSKGKLFLAPMEGVADALMRELLTSVNSFDLCITEFLRIVDSLMPVSTFYKLFPELKNEGYTASNTPVRLQLLGQEPHWMAENAVRAIELGSHGIDLNFGCPAKAVNKNRGGAVLLKTPESIHHIVRSVKEAVGNKKDVSVKIRLGFDDASLLNEIVDAIVSAKADMLTIHARTKIDGYKPPAYWEYITQIEKSYNIPLVANGEIWSREDALRCQNVTNTSNLMIGRGVLSLPNLGNVIQHNEAPLSWLQLQSLFKKFCELELNSGKSIYFSNRLKQWLRYLKLQFPNAQVLFDEIKTLKDRDAIIFILEKNINAKL